MAVPAFWNLVTGLCGGLHAGAMFNAAPQGNPVFAGNCWLFFPPEQNASSILRGGKRGVPKNITVGVRALNNTYIKVRKKRVCAVLKIEVLRKSGWCADLEQLGSTFQFWVLTSCCVTLS